MPQLRSISAESGSPLLAESKLCIQVLLRMSPVFVSIVIQLNSCVFACKNVKLLATTLPSAEDIQMYEYFEWVARSSGTPNPASFSILIGSRVGQRCNMSSTERLVQGYSFCQKGDPRVSPRGNVWLSTWRYVNFGACLGAFRSYETWGIKSPSPHLRFSWSSPALPVSLRQFSVQVITFLKTLSYEDNRTRTRQRWA